MLTNKKAGSLLDSLRAQSDTIRGKEMAPKKTPDEVLKDIDRRMRKTYKWLDEAIGHLTVIRPVVDHEYRIPDVLTIVSPQFDQGFVTYRRYTLAGREVIQYVELFYRATLPGTIKVLVPTASVRGVEDRLRNVQLKFQYRAVAEADQVLRQGEFQVTPVVIASIKFQPDYDRGTIEVMLRNVDRFEAVDLEFAADKFNDEALEDLVRLILGESNTFLRRAPLVGVGVRKRMDIPGKTTQSYMV